MPMAVNLGISSRTEHRFGRIRLLLLLDQYPSLYLSLNRPKTSMNVQIVFSVTIQKSLENNCRVLFFRVSNITIVMKVTCCFTICVWASITERWMPVALGFSVVSDGIQVEI